LKLSIAGVMNFNMFGIPLVGPNICGFISYASSDEESELCGRWIQLSTFYPFARINGDNFTDGNLSEPYNLNGTYLTMAKSSIIERFKYMAFMYTCLF
jgi:alpha-glucosidase (family GH31 glycosyl hydrolase)